MISTFNTVFSPDKIINQSRWWFVCFDFRDFVPDWSFDDRRAAFPALITHQNIAVNCKTLYSGTLQFHVVECDVYFVYQNIEHFSKIRYIVTVHQNIGQQNIVFIAIHCASIQLLKTPQTIVLRSSTVVTNHNCGVYQQTGTTQTMVFIAIPLFCNKLH